MGDAQDELRRRMSPVIALTIDGPSDEALEREEFERAAAETIALWWKALSRLLSFSRAAGALPHVPVCPDASALTMNSSVLTILARAHTRMDAFEAQQGRSPPGFLASAGLRGLG